MSNTLTIADYEECIKDTQRLVRELDVALNGDQAARQASLCDIVSQVKALKKPVRVTIGVLLIDILVASDIWASMREKGDKTTNQTIFAWQYIGKKYPNGIIIEDLKP